jgi:hypothetical protein
MPAVAPVPAPPAGEVPPVPPDAPLDVPPEFEESSSPELHAENIGAAERTKIAVSECRIKRMRPSVQRIRARVKCLRCRRKMPPAHHRGSMVAT